MVTLVALRQLCGDYGRVSEGDTFQVSPEVALELEARGLAYEYHEPQPPQDLQELIARIKGKMMPPPENKMLTVEENKTIPQIRKRGRPLGSKNSPK